VAVQLSSVPVSSSTPFTVMLLSDGSMLTLSMRRLLRGALAPAINTPPALWTWVPGGQLTLADWFSELAGDEAKTLVKPAAASAQTV
jgi:hypothetical protein